jgi:predicted transcriptional regulator
MNIQLEKLNLLEKIVNTNDQSLILELKAFVENKSIDWFEQMSDFQKNEIEEGIINADSKDTIPHEKAVQLFEKLGLK